MIFHGEPLPSQLLLGRIWPLMPTQEVHQPYMNPSVAIADKPMFDVNSFPLIRCPVVDRHRHNTYAAIAPPPNHRQMNIWRVSSSPRSLSPQTALPTNACLCVWLSPSRRPQQVEVRLVHLAMVRHEAKQSVRTLQELHVSIVHLFLPLLSQIRVDTGRSKRRQKQGWSEGGGYWLLQ